MSPLPNLARKGSGGPFQVRDATVSYTHNYLSQLSSSTLNKNMRVLVVDDDLDQLTHLKNVILGWGHQVESASDGEEALKHLSSFTPNVIVTDLKMPRMDGFQLMRQLKAEGILPPTIVLTAFGSIDLAVETVHDYGGFWFLEKPVDTGSLRAL